MAATRRPTNRTQLTPTARADAWQNLANGLGVSGRDAMMGNIFAARAPLQFAQQTSLYRQNWIAGRLVDDIAIDCVRAGFKITVPAESEGADEAGTTEQMLLNEWKRLSLLPILADGLRWSMVYGGAVALLYTDDDASLGQAGEAQASNAVLTGVQTLLAQPLQPASLKVLIRALVVDARYAIPNIGALNADPRSPNFGLPLFYTVTPYGMNAASYIVHWTRVVRFPGVPTDAETRVANLTWGDSIYERPFDAIMRYGVAMAAASALMPKFVQGVLKVKDLETLLASKDRQKGILDRVLAFNLGLSVANVALIDDIETYERMSTNVSGMPEILREIKTEMCAAVRWSESRAFGAQQGKLAGSTQDEANWFQLIDGWQHLAILPALHRFNELIFAQKDGPFKGVPPPGLTIEPLPLQAPDETKQVANLKTYMEAMAIAVDRNILEPSEVTNSTWGGAGVSYAITLDPTLTDARNAAATIETVGEGAEPTPEAKAAASDQPTA